MPTARATIIDPVSVSAERQAQAWLAGIDAEHETQAALNVLNRVLFAHRIATADPHTHEVAAAQALVIRAGWGEGEQLADGLWQHARELPWSTSPRSSRRAAVLRPQERLAELLGARDQELLCEELALRARLDLDHGRLPHAAIELDAALTAALGSSARRPTRRSPRAWTSCGPCTPAWPRESPRRRTSATHSSVWKPRCGHARPGGSHGS